MRDRKSTRLNSSTTEIYTLPYTTLFRSVPLNLLRPVQFMPPRHSAGVEMPNPFEILPDRIDERSEEHTSELQYHRDLHSSLHDALPICPIESPASRPVHAAPALRRCGNAQSIRDSAGSYR